MKHSGIVFLALLLIVSPLFAQKQDARFLTDREKVEAWINEHKVPALGIAVIKDGSIQHLEVFGELKENVSAPRNTLFNVASLTKPIVATLTLKLVERGAWELDEPLANYWVDPEVATDPRHARLTTRHVLSHQTGFVNWRSLHESQKLAFDFEPGSEFRYSGEGFEYLRRALESKFQKPLEQLADSLLFSPLGMMDTHFFWDKKVDESRFAHWHDQEGRQTYETYKSSRANAADDLLTTLEDYTKFALHVLDGAGISADLYKEMSSPQATIKEKNYMGLGWELLPNVGNGETVLLHSGSDFGVKTILFLLPGTKEGLLIMTNGDNGFQLVQKLVLEYLRPGKEIMERA